MTNDAHYQAEPSFIEQARANPAESAERMRHDRPLVAETFARANIGAPRAPVSCAGLRREQSRLEWWAADGGDPAHLVEDFLAEHGLPVRALGPLGATPGNHDSASLCGAALFVSAAAGARMVAAPAGPPSPAPAVPDLVAVVYRHGRPPPAVPPQGARPPGWRLGRWEASWTPEQHGAAVEQARAAIGRGDVYQVNVVGHACARYAGDPLPALAGLAVLPGARYGGMLTGAGWAISCASPETLVEVAGGRVITRPIKGTRPATPHGRHELLASTKERAEHVMIVDLERNDLARVARTGSVRVDELYAIRRWCDLWQAESTISATLDDGHGLADLLRAVCPGGSVTGAPKLAALAEIAALEPVGRGAGMGALGWIGADGMDLGLTIRTAAVDGERVHVWAGGGITWDSEPAAEVAEAAAKAAPVRTTLSGG
jgi:para-aminobenzoate synthetase component 1